MADKEKGCGDKKCPVHSNVIPRGRSFVGVVVSVNPHKTAVVEWERWKYAQKYERYEKKRTKISVHNPACIEAAKGDRVMIRECRPLSKTKNFTIIKKLGKEELFAEKERLMEESKAKGIRETEEQKEAKKEEAKAKKKAAKNAEENDDEVGN